MKTEELCYQADGLDMRGHFAYDEKASGPRPGVLVFPAALGLGEHPKQRAERLVQELGYVALAADLYGQQLVVDSLDKMGPLLEPLRGNSAKIRTRASQALEALKAQPQVDRTRLAAMGFCFGGLMAFELAMTGAELKAAISFHGSLRVASPDDAKKIKGSILALIGADDPQVPAEQRSQFEAAMRAAGVDYQITLYGGTVHAFTEPNAARLGRPEMARYNPVVDARSWQQMHGLLGEVFGQ